jgi:hypothetical protein
MKDELPDLPDIREAGLGVTAALAWWSKMVNTPHLPPSYWWDQLRLLREKNIRMAGFSVQEHPTVQ